MSKHKKILDTVLGMDINIKPYTPHRDCYVFCLNFHDDKGNTEDYQMVFETKPQSPALLQTVLELSFYQQSKRNSFFLPNSEMIFRAPHLEYTDNYFKWVEKHHNYSRQSYIPRVSATLVDYTVFYHDPEGKAFSVDFKLSPEIKKDIMAIYKEYPKDREELSIQAYREKVIVFLEKQLLLAQIKPDNSNITTAKKLKI